MKNPSLSIFSLSEHKAPVTSIKFNPKTKGQIATSSWDGMVRLWIMDVSNPQPVEFLARNTRVWDVDFDADGKTMVSAGKDKMVYFHNVDSEKLVRDLRGDVKGDQQLDAQLWARYVGAEVPYEGID